MILYGLIAGDGESSEAFHRRKERTLPGYRYYLKTFDISVNIVSVQVSDAIPFWEGGRCEVDINGEERNACILLPRKKSRLVSLDELLSHELVHAVRMGFDGGRYEEYLAYRTSKLFYRRWLGPLCSMRYAAPLFALITCLLSATLFTEMLAPWQALMTLGGFTAAGCFYSMRRYATLHKAAFAIQAVTKTPPWKVLLYLSDREIESAARGDFSFMSVQKRSNQLVSILT